MFTRNSKAGLLQHASETAFYSANTPLDAPRAADPSAPTGASKPHPPTPELSRSPKTAPASANPGMLALIRSFAFNVLKANHIDTAGQDRYRAALAGIGNLGTLVAIP